jgi:hypothetical protein
VVRFYLVPEHVALRATCSGTRNDIFRPAGGDIPHQAREHLIHVSIGRFTGFAHVVVFVVQTLTT